jgi:hypothetical protein
MSISLAPIQLVYQPKQRKTKSFQLIMKLSSMNFELRHATIGPDTSFTADWTFNLFLEKGGSNFTTFKDFEELLKKVGYTFSTADPKAIATEFIEGKADNSGSPAGIFIHDQIKLVFPALGNSTVPFTSKSLEVMANPHNLQEEDPYSFGWEVKVKFITTTGNSPAGNDVHYPEILPSTPDPFIFNEIQTLNNWLKMHYELLVAHNPNSTLGKTAGEVTGSIEHLANTIASNLKGPFRTQLLRSGGVNTSDIAFWTLIRKGTDELSFDKYSRFMNHVFCGEENEYAACNDLRNGTARLSNQRQLPFMHVDAYRAVKVATEAFLMVNCSVKKRFDSSDIEDITNNVRIIDGVPDEASLQDYYDRRYKVATSGVSAPIIPYLAVIREKMRSENIKNTAFDTALGNYINSRYPTADECFGLINEKLTEPCFLELIWSYWHEESMMVQGLHAICRRFQNIRGAKGLESLANLQIDPLRPLNNLLWGYIQDHQHRLTVRRRSYEYNHHYGISLKGDATQGMNFADPRSKFIEAFHTLLNLTSRFYKQADDVTVVPDGFPILNGLRETHLILGEGAGNQYGDLPSTSRAEMLMEQWLLARPEFRDFLPSRTMVAYPEPWMDRVSSLNQVLGYTNTSVLHFNYLAIYGEKILLSIRFGNWADTAISSHNAANWAHFWRKEIQGYIHAYRAVTGVDLSADNGLQRVDSLQPSAHLFRRLQEQRQAKGRSMNPSNMATR